MGCFDSTCGLTRTAIKEGDEVLMVQFEEGTNLETSELINDIHFRIRIEDFPRPIQGVYIGSYNSYGSVEGLKIEIDHDSIVLAHLSVAEDLLERKLNRDCLEQDVVELFNRCYLARVQLKGNLYLGIQHSDDRERKLQRILHAAAITILDHHDKEASEPGG